MTINRIVVRLRDRPDTLERVTGLLRRRGFAIQRLSSSFVGSDVIELVICVDAAQTDPERVCRELQTLHDVTEIATVPSTHETREFLLARLRPDVGQSMPLARDGVLEMIGSPDEIDAMLDSLMAQDAISNFVRSGEVAVPKEPHTQQEGKQ